MPLGQFVPPKGDLLDLLGIRQALGQVPLSVGPGRGIQQAMGIVPQGPTAADALNMITPQDPAEALMDLIVPLAAAPERLAGRAARAASLRTPYQKGMKIVPSGKVVEIMFRNTEGRLSGAKVHDAVNKVGRYWTVKEVPLRELNIQTSGIDPSRAVPSKGPVIVSDVGEILDGRHRVLQALNRGDETIEALVPVVDPSKAAYQAPQITSRPVKRVYHGSPHTFDRFDTSKIGTGEGGQAYGHGLYFAEEPAVARQYQEALTGFNAKRPDMLLDGKPVDAKDLFPDSTPIARVRAYTQYRAANGNVDQAISILKKQQDVVPKGTDAGSREFHTKTLAVIEEAKRLVEDLRGKDIQIVPPERGGMMVEVDLLPRDDEFLLWDRPLSEQPPKVQQILKEIQQEKMIAHPSRVGNDPMGAAFYSELVTEAGGREGHTAGLASKELRKRGIRGIKYLDQGSRTPSWIVKERGTGKVIQRAASRDELSPFDTGVYEIVQEQGTHNYVIFDDKDVQILKAMGLIPLAAVGAAATGGE